VLRKQSPAALFSADDRGNVAMMFALSLFPMLAASGAAIDYSRLSSAQTKLQSALDAAVLAAAKDVTIVDVSTLQSRVESFVRANTEGLFKEPVSINMLASGVSDLSVKGRACIQLVFNGIVAAASSCVEVRTDAQRPTQNYIEVAMVLDNSGSMAGTKIDAAKQAATSFVNNLFSGSTDPQKIKISVVPFTLTVNAGSGMNTATDPNLDRFGQSSIHWENLLPANASPPAGVQSRFSLYSQLGETWTGCFEVRPGNWGITDAAPVPGLGDSLFVPMFAPDEPGPRNTSGSFYSVGSVRQNSLNPNGSGGTYEIRNSYLHDDGSATLSYSSGKESSSTQPACTPLNTAYSLPFASPTANWQSLNWLNRSTANICRYNLAGTTGGATSSRKSIASSSGTNGASRGPNFGCNARPLNRLTTDKTSILNAINQMAADGNTNILEGLMWGWRTISPNAPFADGRAYNWNGGLIRNRKYIVLMTDGDNFWDGISNPNLSIYSPFGFYRNNRLGTGITTEAQATAAMNARTRAACDNVKALRDVANNEAVKIITIGFSTAGQEISADGLSLLQDCASTDGGQKMFYKATNASELNQVFALIAANIGRLKLTQ
jgi:Flp pilus assembly protein TadG